MSLTESNQIRESPGHQVEGERVEEIAIVILEQRKLRLVNIILRYLGLVLGKKM